MTGKIRQSPVKVPPSREDDLFRATRRQVERERPQPEPEDPRRNQ
jgi:hypothetical protein